MQNLFYWIIDEMQYFFNVDFYEMQNFRYGWHFLTYRVANFSSAPYVEHILFWFV